MAHRKYYNLDGVEVPSVTTIVKLLQKPGIDSWANWLGFMKVNVKTYMDEKAQYGTYCHDLFEQYFMGFLSMNSLDHNLVTDREFGTILGKFQFIKDEFHKFGIEVVNMELGLDGSRYGGTLDMLAVKKSGDRVFLFDLKTSKTLYDSHLLQLGGYTSLLEELYGISVTDVGIILLSKPVEEMIRIMPRERNRHNEKIFERLVDIYYLQQKGRKS